MRYYKTRLECKQPVEGEFGVRANKFDPDPVFSRIVNKT
jgi:hypothetical protein